MAETATRVKLSVEFESGVERDHAGRAKPTQSKPLGVKACIGEV